MPSEKKAKTQPQHSAKTVPRSSRPVFSVASKTRGRPTITNAELSTRRGALTFLLEVNWAVVGWPLGRVKQGDDLRNAFSALRGSNGEDLIKPYLRERQLQSTDGEIRGVENALATAVPAEADAQRAYECRRQEVQFAEAAAYEASPTNQKSLRIEVTRRLVNVRTLRNDLDAIKKRFNSADAALRDAQSAGTRQEPGVLAAAQENRQAANVLLGRAQFACDEEQKILDATKERCKRTTNTRWVWAKKEVKKRKVTLLGALDELTRARTHRERLEDCKLNLQAEFMKTELARFIRSKRAAHTPSNLACAMAGLPELGCRTSFTRCRFLLKKMTPEEKIPGLNFQIFEFIQRVWKRRSSGQTTIELLKLFRDGIEQLPKTQRRFGKRTENFLRKYLEENSWALKKAIIDGKLSTQHPKAAAFRIAEAFQKNLSRSLTALDRLELEQEKL